MPRRWLFSIWMSAALAAASSCGVGGLYLDRRVESRFQGRLFELPARVYARAPELTAGLHLERAGVIDHLERTGYLPLEEGAPVGPGRFVRTRRELVIGRRPFSGPGGPEPGGVVRVRSDGRGRIARLIDADGRPLRVARLEPEEIGAFHGAHWEDRRPLPLEAFPESVVEAVLAVEDQRFYEHPGLDVRRVVGAAFANLREGRIAQGGSSITQQLVKNFYLSPDRSLWRKLREAPMALLLERRHEKREILEAYLNEIYLGQRGAVSILGLGAAARHYFGKDPRDLEIAETALLVGLIRSPGHYAPHTRPEQAKARRDTVLAVLRDQGLLSDEDHARAVAAPLAVRPLRDDAYPAPYFLAHLRRELEPAHGEEALERSGYAVHSSLDAQLQRIAQRAVRRGLDGLEERFPKLVREGAPLQAALVALDPETGAVLAHVGGRDFAASQFDRVTQARRQPGSAFKPIFALAALSRGEDGEPAFTLASRLDDEPLLVPGPEGEDEDWEPTNYDGEFLGWVTLREALERSLNVPIARAGLELGARRVAATARRLGIESPLRRVPSLVLGASEVTLLELVRAYAVFAAEGVRVEPRSVWTLQGTRGEELAHFEPRRERVATPDEVYLVTSALEGAVERGTARGLRGLGYHGPVAGKTGTTNEYRDAWFLGYTPEVVVGVWVGFDDNESIGVSGATAALPIFADFLVGALGPEGGRDFERPLEVERVRVNTRLEKRAGFGCPGEREVFLVGTAPRESCGGADPLDWLRARVFRRR